MKTENNKNNNIFIDDNDTINLFPTPNLNINNETNSTNANIMIPNSDEEILDSQQNLNIDKSINEQNKDINTNFSINETSQSSSIENSNDNINNNYINKSNNNEDISLKNDLPTDLIFGNELTKEKAKFLGNCLVLFYYKNFPLLTIGPDCKNFLIINN